MEIRRRGQWQTEERLLLPGYVFVGAEYRAALFHVVSPVSGVIRWLGLEDGKPQALDTRDALRWRLDSDETLEPSRVLFRADGTWHVLGRPSGGFCRLPGTNGAAAAPGVCDGGAGRRSPAGAVRRYPRDRGQRTMKRRTGPAARTGTEALRREAEGAAGAVHAVRVDDAGERPPRLPCSPAACGAAPREMWKS